jgi:hypothetical protein
MVACESRHFFVSCSAAAVTAGPRLLPGSPTTKVINKIDITKHFCEFNNSLTQLLSSVKVKLIIVNPSFI